MRLVSTATAVLLIGLWAIGLANAGQSDFRLTLIGSGTPVPAADRFGPATLVEAGEQKLLFDAGRGRVAWVDLGHIVPAVATRRQTGAYLSAQIAY